jgi:SAM-dependent methyltransferase
METVPCDLCGATDVIAIYTGTAWRQTVPEGLALVQCRHCELVYLNPRPSKEEIASYYPDDYQPYRTAIEDEPYWLMRRMRQAKLAQRRNIIQEYSGLKTGKILDVGCATGLFLNEMVKSGWEGYGVEPNSKAAGYARERFGLQVFQGLLSETPFPRESFDVVTFWDVLEHTHSPIEELRRTAEILSPSGLVAINIPNWDSPDRKMFGPHWIGYDPPRHLFAFSRKTLGELLDKTGFSDLHWACFMPSYFAFSISLDRWLSYRSPGLANPLRKVMNFPGVRILFEPYFFTANQLGFGSVISVFARKKSMEPHIEQSS